MGAESAGAAGRLIGNFKANDVGRVSGINVNLAQRDGVGVYSIHFETSLSDTDVAHVTVNNTTDTAERTAQASINPGTGLVTVRTFNAAGAAVDSGFNLSVFGGGVTMANNWT